MSELTDLSQYRTEAVHHEWFDYSRVLLVVRPDHADTFRGFVVSETTGPDVRECLAEIAKWLEAFPDGETWQLQLACNGCQLQYFWPLVQHSKDMAIRVLGGAQNVLSWLPRRCANDRASLRIGTGGVTCAGALRHHGVDEAKRIGGLWTPGLN